MRAKAIVYVICKRSLLDRGQLSFMSSVTRTRTISCTAALCVRVFEDTHYIHIILVIDNNTIPCAHTYIRTSVVGVFEAGKASRLLGWEARDNLHDYTHRRRRRTQDARAGPTPASRSRL